MRMRSQAGRALMATDAGWVDVATASADRWGPSVQDVLDEWDAFTAWAGTEDLAGVALTEIHLAALEAPVPAPSQVFVVGLNYRPHAEEVGLEIPDRPHLIHKFPSSIGRPFDDLALPSNRVDYEVEIVAVIGRAASGLKPGEGIEHVAGLSIGQDFSERRVQMRADAPILAKSLLGFTRFGPDLVTLDELNDITDVVIECSVNGEVVQRDTLASMIFPIGTIVEYLSRFCTLRPGDLVYTGTPAGVGMAQDPQRFLAPGDIVESSAAGIGRMRQKCVETENAPDLLAPASPD